MSEPSPERVLPVYGVTGLVATKQFLRVLHPGLEFCGMLNSLAVKPLSMPYAMPRVLNEETLAEGFLPIWNRLDFMHFLLALLMIDVDGAELQIVHHSVREPLLVLFEPPPKLEISVWDVGAVAELVAGTSRSAKESDPHPLIPGLRRMWKPASVEFEGVGARKARAHFSGVMKLYRDGVRRVGGVKVSAARE